MNHLLVGRLDEFAVGMTVHLALERFGQSPAILLSRNIGHPGKGTFGRSRGVVIDRAQKPFETARARDLPDVLESRLASGCVKDLSLWPSIMVAV